MQELTITVEGKAYTIMINERYADAVRKDLASTISTKHDNDIITLIKALVGKSVTCVQLRKELSQIADKLEIPLHE